MEAEAARCNTLKALSAVSERDENFRGASLDSLSPHKILLTDLMKRLDLNQYKFIVFAAASEQEMEEFWSLLIALDSEFTLNYFYKVCENNLSHTLS